jgi:hypothetical protein
MKGIKEPLQSALDSIFVSTLPLRLGASVNETNPKTNQQSLQNPLKPQSTLSCLSISVYLFTPLFVVSMLLGFRLS